MVSLLSKSNNVSSPTKALAGNLSLDPTPSLPAARSESDPPISRTTLSANHNRRSLFSSRLTTSSRSTSAIVQPISTTAATATTSPLDAANRRSKSFTSLEVKAPQPTKTLSFFSSSKSNNANKNYVSHTNLSSPSPGPHTHLPAIEASYVSKVGISLCDAVNKIFGTTSQSDTYKGRPAPNREWATELGNMILREMDASRDDHYLLRALLRSAVLKALSILMSRLTTLIETIPSGARSPPITEDSRTLSVLPSSTSATFNMSIARAALEVAKSLDKVNSICDENGKKMMPLFVLETLRPWILQLRQVADKVLVPIVSNFQQGVAILVGQARWADDQRWANDLRTYLTSIKAMVEGRLGSNRGDESEKLLIRIALHTIWKGMLAISARHISQHALGSSTPSRQSSLQVSVTAPDKKTGLRLPGRKPSPPPGSATHSEKTETPDDRKAIHQAESLKDVVNQFVARIYDSGQYNSSNDNRVECKLKNCPVDCQKSCRKGLRMAFCEDDVANGEEDGNSTTLPSEAMMEALDSLEAFVFVLRASPRRVITVELFESIYAQEKLKEEGKSPESDENFCPILQRALVTIPPIILLHVLASRISERVGFRLPHEIWGTTWEMYEGALVRFASGNEMCGDVGWEMEKEYKRVKTEREEEKDIWLENVKAVIDCGIVAIE